MIDGKRNFSILISVDEKRDKISILLNSKSSLMKYKWTRLSIIENSKEQVGGVSWYTWSRNDRSSLLIFDRVLCVKRKGKEKRRKRRRNSGRNRSGSWSIHVPGGSCFFLCFLVSSRTAFCFPRPNRYHFASITRNQCHLNIFLQLGIRDDEWTYSLSTTQLENRLIIIYWSRIK